MILPKGKARLGCIISPELVGGAEVPEGPVGEFPDEPLAMRHGPFAVVAFQLVHHDAQAADEGRVGDAARPLQLRHEAHQELGGLLGRRVLLL